MLDCRICDERPLGGGQFPKRLDAEIDESLEFRGGSSCARTRGLTSKADDLAARLKRFATRLVKFARTLPREPACDTIARQLVGSGTGESSNHHSARRARSRAEFIAKIAVAAEEADETEHWLAIVTNSGVVRTAAGVKELDWLVGEARQLRAILVQSVKTARANSRKSSTP